MRGAGGSLRERLQRVAEALARRPGLRWVVRRVVPPIDRVLHRLSGGRWQLGSAVLPMLVLSVRGRRTGQLRRTSLLYVRDGDDLLVVGSNFGRADHPAWSTNLLVADTASVNVRGREWTVRPVLLGGPDREAAWPVLLRTWPVYRDYQRETQRQLRVFRLEPIG